jgi:signal transduction histidine kinase
MKWIRFGLLACLLLCCYGIVAQPVQVLTSKELEIAPEGLAVLPVCDTVTWAWPQVEQANFELGMDYQKGCSHWLRARVFVPDSLEGMYLIQQSTTWGEVVFYIPNKSGGYSSYRNGRLLSPEKRDWNYPNYDQAHAFLASGDTLVLYVHVKAPVRQEGRRPSLSLLRSTSQMTSEIHAEHTWMLVAVAGMVLFAFYNFGLYLYIRDRSYLFYVLYLLLFALHATTRRLYFLMWLPYPTVTAIYAIALSGVPATLLFWQFARYYLGGEALLPRLYRRIRLLLRYLSGIILLCCVLYLLYYDSMAVVAGLISNFLILVGVIVVFYWAWRLYRQKHVPARHFLLASAVLLPFMVIYLIQGTDKAFTALLFNLIPSTPFTRASLNIGILAQAVAFSLALAARINLLRNQVVQEQQAKERLERERLLEIQRLLERQRQELEVAVQERTLSLQETNEELKVSEERLASLNRTKDRFFALISHDLRGPVSSFQDISQLLRHQLDRNRPERVQELMDQVDRAAQQLGQLLDNLLQWAQSQLGGMTYRPEAVPLAPLAADIREMYASRASLKGLDTQLDIPLGLCAWADPAGLAAILRNLWGNAVKFTEQGQVRLTARAEGAEVHITLRDTGVGMPPEKLATLFELQSASSTRGTRGEKGNGLGLQLCHTFAQQQGGRLSVESAPGQGTTVHLWLPVGPSLPND